jgi:hypothetical protein
MRTVRDPDRTVMARGFRALRQHFPGTGAIPHVQQPQRLFGDPDYAFPAVGAATTEGVAAPLPWTNQ